MALILPMSFSNLVDLIYLNGVIEIQKKRLEPGTGLL